MLTALCRGEAEQPRCDCPTLAIIRKNGYRLFVIANNYAKHLAAHIWLKGDAITDAEAKHGCVGSCMLHKTEPLNNAIVEINELGFCQLVDINDHEV